jgi:Ser/Thr protein kinase RdoA (MazF antagonist)
MTASIPTVHALTAFDAFSRGAAAPDWVTAGIRGRWLPGETDVAVTLIAISENATFRVAVAGRDSFVVRMHRPGYLGSLARARSELVWVEAVARDTGIRTPTPVRGSDGEFVQSYNDDDGMLWTAVAFSFAAGTVLESISDDISHYREIGRLTATLHEHSRTWRRPAGFERFDWGLDDLVGPAARWGDWAAADLSADEAATLRSAQRSAVEVISARGAGAEDWGLIHSDLRPSNILVEAGELTIIDFDDCGFSWRLYDFAAALTFYEHRPSAKAMAAHWLDGYREVATLHRGDLELAAALSMIRRLTMLGWATTHRADALPADLWDENLPGTVDVAHRYLEDSLWLVDPA